MKTYSPQKVILTAAAYQLSGYASGTFIEAERDADDFGDDAGSDGDVCRVEMLDKRGKITVTLKQDSASNDFLSSLLSAKTVFSVQIKELNGQTLCHGAEAWVLKPAQASYGDAVSNREWTIRVAALDMRVGSLNED